MTESDRLQALEDAMSEFEKENPELAETVRLMGHTIEQYD